MTEFVVWDKGKPVAATPKEADRINKRMRIIVKVLEGEYGYKNAFENYGQIMTEMAQKNFGRYMKFLARVDELAGKAHC